MTTDGLVAGGNLRRQHMLKAAAEIIAERGISETRIADVAERAGASPALVIYYFKTKDRLLSEALRHSDQRFYDAVEAMLRRTPTLRSRLETLVRWTCDPDSVEELPGSWGLWFDLWATAFRVGEVRRDRIELDQLWRTMISRLVTEAQAVGEVAEAVDADDFAVSFSALLDGLSIQVALGDPVVRPQYAFDIALRFASQALQTGWHQPAGKS
jgi:AcrR family transcriptional regulator